ncbi:MAG: nuclear transport factor 2 family protein, partial [Chitinophagales bacterium]
PTNKDVSVDFITVFEFDNAGKIKKMTAQNNSYSFMVQLGVATPPNPNSNIPAVMAVYENFGKGNIPGIIDAMDKNVVWDMRQNPFVNDARIYTGSQDVYNFFKSLQTSWAVLQFIPIDFSEVGNKVYVDGAFEYTLLKDNKNYHVNWTMIWEFKDGKPIHYVELFDTPQLIK